MNLPSHWKNMPFTAKAAHLVATGQSKDFSDACSKLAKMRRTKPLTPVRAAVPQEFWWNK